MEALKAIGGLILLAGIVLGVLMTGFIFSWVFKLIGFVLVALAVVAFVGWCAWEILSGWWQDRREQKKKGK